ncbi:serine threonine-protein kinase cbk1 [Colletotrichum kahawae]|uniref:non-specific serine/threonine protein kinase n=1 Tax=Colletotrichum kahawae TaxID=34407 RepID=A0AAD9YCA9_COLKA|nr:serine threonine-protein kinase cbk1 [Colletotrichum kahawae]
MSILGKGSFGVVKLVRKLVRDKYVRDKDEHEVYAMKIIRKSDMIRSCQEGHLRAERDFLVAASNSEWIVPLLFSFQDIANLYLVMDYMPGGDFLGLLIREKVLSESRTRFYIAEMILCVEEAHKLGCIHRDVKPDNFLIGADGHLKISDFGLAFDDHWSHDTSYYKWQRQGLLSKQRFALNGDYEDRKSTPEQAQRQSSCQLNFARHEPPFQVVQGSKLLLRERLGQENRNRNNRPRGSSDCLLVDNLLNWRATATRRSYARSVVGTSQYMAPEVVLGENIGIILYECLYGYTPFISDKGRQYTKKNITKFRETLVFSEELQVSAACVHLIRCLLEDKDHRLSSPKYRDQESLIRRRYVFPNDASDIKKHPWFRGIRWSELRERTPKWLPRIHGDLDTRYFEEDEPISDWSDSLSSGVQDVVDGNGAITDRAWHTLKKSLSDARYEEEHFAFLLDAIKQPYDSTRLKQIDRDIDERFSRLSYDGKNGLKEYVRKYGQKERKRPRDMLLRDPDTKDEVMQLRKQTAFLGYSWRKPRSRLQPAHAQYDVDPYDAASQGEVFGYPSQIESLQPARSF